MSPTPSVGNANATRQLHVVNGATAQQDQPRRRRAGFLVLASAAFGTWAITSLAALPTWVPGLPASFKWHSQQRQGVAVRDVRARVASDLVNMLGDAEPLAFDAREVGSAEQLMFSRMPAGHMITTHSYVAIVEGQINPQRLQEALQWSIVRHPMLRARVEAGEKSTAIDNPFFSRWEGRQMDVSAQSAQRGRYCREGVSV